ncbi:AI-2E family transporter [Streptomyces violaceorubidus]
MVTAAGFVTLLGSMLAGQIVEMVENFPDYLDFVINWVNSHFRTDTGQRVDIQEGLLRSDWLRNYVQNSATGVLDVSAQVLGGLFELADDRPVLVLLRRRRPPAAARTLLRLPPARQAEVLRAWEIAVDKTGGYLYSRGLMALISGIAHYILLEVLRCPTRPRSRCGWAWCRSSSRPSAPISRVPCRC